MSGLDLKRRQFMMMKEDNDKQRKRKIWGSTADRLTVIQ